MITTIEPQYSKADNTANKLAQYARDYKELETVILKLRDEYISDTNDYCSYSLFQRHREFGVDPASFNSVILDYVSQYFVLKVENTKLKTELENCKQNG